jgi:hypothetical protein
VSLTHFEVSAAGGCNWRISQLINSFYIILVCRTSGAGKPQQGMQQCPAVCCSRFHNIRLSLLINQVDANDDGSREVVYYTWFMLKVC